MSAKSMRIGASHQSNHSPLTERGSARKARRYEPRKRSDEGVQSLRRGAKSRDPHANVQNPARKNDNRKCPQSHEPYWRSIAHRSHEHLSNKNCGKEENPRICRYTRRVIPPSEESMNESAHRKELHTKSTVDEISEE